jgi:hypothetical protein
MKEPLGTHGQPVVSPSAFGKTPFVFTERASGRTLHHVGELQCPSH